MASTTLATIGNEQLPIQVTANQHCRNMVTFTIIIVIIVIVIIGNDV